MVLEPQTLVSPLLSGNFNSNFALQELKSDVGLQRLSDYYLVVFCRLVHVYRCIYRVLRKQITSTTNPSVCLYLRADSECSTTQENIIHA